VPTAAAAVVKAVSGGSYDGGLRELIHLLKYEQVRPAAAGHGRMLAEAVRGLEPGWNEHSSHAEGRRAGNRYGAQFC